MSGNSTPAAAPAAKAPATPAVTKPPATPGIASVVVTDAPAGKPPATGQAQAPAQAPATMPRLVPGYYVLPTATPNPLADKRYHKQWIGVDSFPAGSRWEVSETRTARGATILVQPCGGKLLGGPLPLEKHRALWGLVPEPETAGSLVRDLCDGDFALALGACIEAGLIDPSTIKLAIQTHGGGAAAWRARHGL